MLGREIFLEEEPHQGLFESLPLPLLIIGPANEILAANPAAEQFFGIGADVLRRQAIHTVFASDSPVLELAAQARTRTAPVAEHDVNVSTRRGGERVCDISVAPYGDGVTVIALHQRSFAQRRDRQLLHRGAARSLSAMAAVLAHEIKNPLAGIRGAAQLLEDSLGESDREMIRLICEETDRIRALIDRMETFGDSRPVCYSPINIHEVLDHTRKLARAGFARHATFAECYDPSLPPVFGNRDQLIQIFVNLVRNSADALAPAGGEITLATAFRSGMRVCGAGAGGGLALPLEIAVRDNGVGIPPDLLPNIFDPFVTTKPRGAGLGLALAAKLVGEHGGVVECESVPGRTQFRILLPAAQHSEAA